MPVAGVMAKRSTETAVHDNSRLALLCELRCFSFNNLHFLCVKYFIATIHTQRKFFLILNENH